MSPPERDPARCGIHSIRLCGFRRYGDASVRFAPGVNFLEGPNNAGKTSLLYAIEYALFGRVGSLTPEGLMKPGADGMGVELVFDGKDGKRYRLQRVHLRKGSAKVSKATKSGKSAKSKPTKASGTLVGHFTLKTIDADGAERYELSSDFDHREDHLASAIHAAIGVGRRAWDLAVHLRQGAIPELLTGSQQLDIVLGITPAVVVEEELRALARDKERAIEELPAVLAALAEFDLEHESRKERLEALTEELERERERMESAAEAALALSARRRGLAPLEAQIAKAQAAERALERAREGVSRASAEREARGESLEREEALRAASAQVSALASHRDSDKERITEARAAARALDQERGDVSARLLRRSKLVADALCEHCGQPIDAAHIEREREELGARLAEIDARIAEAQARIAAAETCASQRQEALSSAKLAERDAERALEEVTRAELALSGAIAARAEAEDALEGILSGIPDRDLPALVASYARQLDEIKAEEVLRQAERKHLQEKLSRVEGDKQIEANALRSLERQRADAESRRARLERDSALAERLRALAAGFKSVQQELREEATRRLAERTLALHELLSGESQELSLLSIEPKGYSVLVTPNDVGTEVPAALYQGGGHRMLLGIAFRLAIAEQLGRMPFILLDEPTYGLDSARRAELLARVSSLSVADQILVITHHEIGRSTAHRIRVVPEGTASRLELV